MGKQKEQKKKQFGSSRKQKRKCDNESPRGYDKDTVAFISLSQELREEGNRLFQRRDYEVAMLMYEKAIKLLPGNHIDVPYLRSNMAACYMQMGSSEYPKAVYECNLALEVNPNYTKALLKRARCYEALSRLDLALRDAKRVMQMEKNNFMAAEIAERVKATIDQNGGAANIPVDLIPVPEYVEPPILSNSFKAKDTASSVGKKKKKRQKKNIEEEEEEEEDDDEENGKGPSDIVASRAAKKREKKAKKKKNGNGRGKATDEDDDENKFETKKKRVVPNINGGIQGKKKKKKDSDISSGDEEEEEEAKCEESMATSVENNRFDILSDSGKDKDEEEKEEEEEDEKEEDEEKMATKKNKKKVPDDNEVCEKKKKVEKKKCEEEEEEKKAKKKNKKKVPNGEEEEEEKKAKKRNKKKAPSGKDEKDDEEEEDGDEDEEKKAKKKNKKKKMEKKKCEEEEEEEDEGEEDEEKKAKKKNKKKVPNGNEVCENKKKVEKKKCEEERKAEDKLVVGEIMIDTEATVVAAAAVEPRRTVKLIFGDDIRFAQVPTNCTVLKLREIICDRFPNCKSILIKYKDQEGDMVTMTTNEEFKWAQSSVAHGFIRLHIVDVNPDQDPLLQKILQEEEEEEEQENEVEEYEKQTAEIESPGTRRRESDQLGSTSCIIDDWTIHFAYLFKSYVGFESDCYLDLHDVGVKLYSEAMEETVTSEEAQDIFTTSEEKFQELAALSLFNWGNVQMSKARRRAFTDEYTVGDSESMMSQITDAFTSVQKEYIMAGKRFEEALKIKPNFYEAIIALGQLQFEQAKLSWQYAISTETDLESWPSSEVLQLYSNASRNMERGIKMWEEALVQHLIQVANNQNGGTHGLLQQMKLGNLFSEVSAEETAEQASNIRSQVNLLWGTMLYERSVVEFKLGVPNWEQCLGAASHKFELAGASQEDIAVMVKNHCSNSLEGYNVDETEQAWNEMYEAIRWQMEIPALHLEPLIRQRVSRLQHPFDNNNA
ncbi:protein PHOX4-like [Ipomoea triloba]|uniref:protein PHOX4-like n=1 Tax=Ipomoea triloba TaxID=35885 RepID=UPI00125D3232|nr:protein PHOX4-like [Ipomoea triloba]